MSGLNWGAVDWAGPDVVLACQLVSAAALTVHLLILRPRAARRDLLLDARIVQDELDLAERLGHVTAANPETLALQQLLRRVRQNPRSARLVLDRIPALSRAAQQGSPPMHVEYLTGALDRLGDAAQRYLRGAWPRGGTLSAEPAGPVVDLSPPTVAPAVAPAVPPTVAPVVEPDDDRDGAAGDLADSFQHLDDGDLESDLDGNEPPWTAAEDAGRSPIDVDLTDPDWSPAWVDLVRVEKPSQRAAARQADRHDRHSRPFRPGRSSGHPPSRLADPSDRPTVLPR
jgi:hypothetical protein